MNTIAEQWEDFAREVLPDDVSEVQLREMRRAFYAGSLSSLSSLYLLHNLAGMSEAAAVGILAGLHEECLLFGLQVANGEA